MEFPENYLTIWLQTEISGIFDQMVSTLGSPQYQSRSQSFVPLEQRSENESSGSFQITMEITEFCISGFTAHARAVRSLHVWYLWRMPEMDAPRNCSQNCSQSSRFPTAGQGERSSGNEIATILIYCSHARAWMSWKYTIASISLTD